MARRKRTSAVLEAAHRRLAGLKSPSEPIDFGPTLTLTAYETQITNFDKKLDNYNQMVSTLDGLQNELDADEAELRVSNQRYLSAAEAHYGPDSSVYEQAGGTRSSERKKPKPKGGSGTPPAP